MKRVIRRLQAADINNPNLEEKMHIEDEYLQALIERDNQISFLQQEKENLIKEVKENKKEVENVKKEAQDAKNEVEENKTIIIELAKFLKSQGLSAEQISKKTNLSVQEINELQTI